MEVNQQEIEQKIEEMKQHIRKAEVSTCSLIKTKITIPTMFIDMLKSYCPLPISNECNSTPGVFIKFR
jgi:hypothetical protein